MAIRFAGGASPSGACKKPSVPFVELRSAPMSWFAYLGRLSRTGTAYVKLLAWIETAAFSEEKNEKGVVGFELLFLVLLVV